MVSFQCDGCADTVKKPQLDKHRQRCWASFTCLDCSTTFQNQEYKSHTSCISEAEKYQGKLYRGPKGSTQASTQTSAAASPAPASAPAASEGASIHPSRLRQVEADNSGFDAEGGGYGRGGYGGRGRGFQRGRGRGGFTAPRAFKPTGENLAQPETGMRSWGSTPVPEPSAPAEEGKKKKRKGDKGGTGSKANSSSKHVEEPASKKRKRDGSAAPEVAPAATAAGAPSDKALKRIRKHMGKLEKEESMALSQWIDKIAAAKEKSVDRADVLAGLKVSFVDGKWQLSA
ncbi:hypothetical protein CC85DRAFT_325402 [Cutaneotrichosporon oleaginosum]|uniref:Zinc finger C2H2 LYAR-type domain-containing protein n=1 Tax=Cutaneotrichosporon oleaginosum TaxID=879819 RepID=A0A0J0XX69_9TREE|nr:uncharacterized protein CC85DRAFT_325402 [Cutaneotrichosporon oleaginosum]KLT45677.1 hypothetical protein CC85DRAFT_325402 [Cutaneotrichosporon oleaginosum]